MGMYEAILKDWRDESTMKAPAEFRAKFGSEDPEIPEILEKIGDIHSASFEDISNVVEQYAGGLTPRYRKLMSYFKALKNENLKEGERPLSITRDREIELQQSKRLNESFDSDTRTSVKVVFYGRDRSEVEDIVEEVNELYNTTFFSHELGNKIYVESSTLFTSVAKLEDILEEFLSRGAKEIRFIKA